MLALEVSLLESTIRFGMLYNRDSSQEFSVLVLVLGSLRLTVIIEGGPFASSEVLPLRVRFDFYACLFINDIFVRCPSGKIFSLLSTILLP